MGLKWQAQEQSHGTKMAATGIVTSGPNYAFR